MIAPDTPTTADVLRRGVLYGAAIGLLGGLLHVGLVDYRGTQAIDVWRNWILGGAAVGLAIGIVRAMLFKTNDDKR